MPLRKWSHRRGLVDTMRASERGTYAGNAWLTG
jgi:hypothetical protein